MAYHQHECSRTSILQNPFSYSTVSCYCIRSCTCLHVKRYGVPPTSLHEVCVQRSRIHVPCHWDYLRVIQIDYCIAQTAWTCVYTYTCAHTRPTMTGLIDKQFTEALNKAYELYEGDHLEECQQAAINLLEDDAILRYHHIKTLILLATILGG